MAHVTLAAPITGLSGKLSKSHAVVFNMRQAATNNERMINMPCYTNWRPKGKKRDVTEWNTQFAEIARMTRERLEDPAFMATDQAAFIKQSKFKAVAASTAARVKLNAPEDVAAFKAQKKYKSFRSYIWALEWADYTA